MTGRAPHVCSAPQCSKVIEHGERCPVHGSKPYQSGGQRSESSRRTGTRRFNTIVRPAVFRRDNFTCQLNLPDVCASRGNSLPATELECDHIVEVSAGGSDDIDQCRTVCIPCHRRRTAIDAGKSVAQQFLEPSRSRRKPAAAERPVQIPRMIYLRP